MTSHICLAWRGLGIKQQSGWKEQMDKETAIHSAHSSTNISSSFKIPHSIIFYSKVDSNYCLFPQAEWMCNFLHLLGNWQFDNQRTATAVLPTNVLPLRQCLFFSTSQACLDTHFCHSFPFLSPPAYFSLLHSSHFCTQKHVFLSRCQFSLTPSNNLTYEVCQMWFSVDLHQSIGK